VDATVTRAKRSALRWTLVRERAVVLIALVIVVIVSVLAMMRTGDMLMMGRYGALAYAVLLFLMWWTMMMAMMLPSAAPAILTFASINERLTGRGTVAEFTLGYGLVWTLFSLMAAALHLIFETFVPFTGMMAVTSRTAGGILLIAAGLYQVTPLKAACLRHCQAPVFFLARHWRAGRAGALAMGLHHGLYCLGCCWVLMAVLFYGGVMELSWIAGLALYVLAEKLIPAHWPMRHLSGAVLILWGAVVLVRTWIA